MSRRVLVRHGAYRDSVSLMRTSQQLSALPGVHDALVAMATELNLDLLEAMGFEAPPEPSPNDMLVAVHGDSDSAVDAALHRLDTLLAEPAAAPSGPGPASAPPRTLRRGARGADLALISTPGQHAAADALEALETGLDVMLFSDNVSVEHEVLLKTVAARTGRLVMGPDCGTAVVGGVGLGFANVVKPGPVGIVAASGTGAQHLMCLLDAADVGVSHCLGVGSRDLSAPVGAGSTLAALRLLAGDDTTERIVVVSKPPDPDVAGNVREEAARLGVPVHFAFIGPERPTLTDVAEQVVRALDRPWQQPSRWTPAGESPRPAPGRSLRGVFSGGTLCQEAMAVAVPLLGPVRSNVPLDPEWALGDDLRAEGHVMVDFGDDRLTRGRPHPMIDNTLRSDRIRAEGSDPSCGVLLLDVVLGHAAHPDPAHELAPAIRQARQAAADDGRDLAVVASLTGTSADPQGLERQAEALREAGASVHRSNADAARTAVALVGGS